MPVSFDTEIAKLASVDLFKRNKNGQFETGTFIGRPFHLDYDCAQILIADAWKFKVHGVPHGSLLLAYFENEDEVSEALLLRVLRPTKLPSDSDVISSMIEFYKDNQKTSGKENQLDSFTRYEFSFSGLECRILGTFYRDPQAKVHFGADVENFYSSHNYVVVKPTSDVLALIVNFREGEITGKPTDIRIGSVRYSSSRRFQKEAISVPVFVTPSDFLGKRTALFGMTRTGKSNTVKKIIQASVSMSRRAPHKLDKPPKEGADENLEPFTKDGIPKFPAGQIIFDVNGEYANPNMQDAGTAIFELYRDQVTRYSVLEKPGFKVMRVNFYKDILSGFELIRSHLALDGADYVNSVLSIDFVEPEDKQDFSTMTRHGRKVAAYLSCLYRAGFKVPKDFKVKFSGEKDINALARPDGSLDPSKGIPLDEAADWFSAVWENYDSADYFIKYRQKKGREWADEDLKALMIFLTRKSKPGGNPNNSGYIKLRAVSKLHTETVGKAFETEIVEELRKGKIIIVDLSQGDPAIQGLYSDSICRKIFIESMGRFIENLPNNFIQFYFEEAHNLFPKKDDKDLSQIYNRLAKEGAKLNLGLIYATQEVSSISSNILKNTQNWFIAHLNNEEETKEIKKYYDFGDFTDSLVRFSANSDKGFVRMKTYSNPFVVPVQIDRFLAEEQA
jgi:DNA helicase HerA-like ATPase